MVAHPLAGVPCGGHDSGVAGEPVAALQGGAQIAHGDQELLGPEDLSHPRQALLDDVGLRAATAYGANCYDEYCRMI
jgi:hypothetical protein